MTAHVLHLHRCGLSFRRIAGIENLTEREVVTVLRNAGALPPRVKLRKPKPPAVLPPEPPGPPPPRGRVNPVRSALQILGSRARETPGGWAVDGRPVGSFDLIRKANAVLKAAGQPQMDACGEWVVGD